MRSRLTKPVSELKRLWDLTRLILKRLWAETGWPENFKFKITEKKKVFDNEKIKYLPTIILYHNGDEVIRVESGISLKLPENTIELIEEKIEEIIESKF